MIETIKMSEFIDGGDIENNNTTIGLEDSNNVRFNNPWTFLKPGSTGDRPAPSSAIDYRLRLNTTLESYEYYSPVLAEWIQIQDSIDVQTFPFVIYTAEPLLPNSFNLGSLGDGILKQSVLAGVSTPDIAINGTDYYGPGFTGYLESPAGIKDINGYVVLEFSAHAGLVQNYLTISNNVAGNPPTLLASGTDSGIRVRLQSKGDAGIQFATAAVVDPFLTVTSGTLSQHTTQFIAPDTAAIRAVTFQDASGTVAYLTDIPSVSPAALTRVNDTNVTLTLDGTPASALLQAVSLNLGWSGQLAISRGGTEVSSVTTSPTASSWAGWDANSNLSANNFLSQYEAIVTSGGTTTLTVASKYNQVCTGTLNHTIMMPAVNTLTLGQAWNVPNNSTGNITIQSSGGNQIIILGSGESAIIQCNSLSGTTATSWNVQLIVAGKYLTITNSSGVALTTTTNTDITTLTLDGGDWDVSGCVNISPSVASLTVISGWINTSSASGPTVNYARFAPTNPFGLTSFAVPNLRVSVPQGSTQTVYLSCTATFGSGTATALGVLNARRAKFS